MSMYLVIAGCLAVIVGVIHSILGEILIFRHMRKGTFIPIDGGTILKERHVRILWASWHIVSIFGWGFAVILFWIALPIKEASFELFAETIIMSTMFIASLVVLIATKAKHPGWIGLLCITIFVWLGLET